MRNADNFTVNGAGTSSSVVICLWYTEYFIRAVSASFPYGEYGGVD